MDEDQASVCEGEERGRATGCVEEKRSNVAVELLT